MAAKTKEKKAKAPKKSEAVKEDVPVAATPKPSAPIEAFPPELASPTEPKHERVPMPAVPSDADPFKFNQDPTGADRDKMAAQAVTQGLYKPGVEPHLEPNERVFEAPDGVLFAGPKNEDQFKDPRNGRMIRPRRGASFIK